MVIATCLYALDLHWKWVKVGIAAAILNPVLNLLLIPVTQHVYENGAIGAAIVTVVTEAFMLAAGLRLLRTSLLSSSILSDGLRNLTAGGVMVLAILLVRDASLLVVVVVGTLSYALAAFGLKTVSIQECKSMFIMFRTRATAQAEPTVTFQ
jgi:hypothetical protein